MISDRRQIERGDIGDCVILRLLGEERPAPVVEDVDGRAETHYQPVLAIHIMSSKYGPLSPAGRQPRRRSGESKGSITAQSPSERPTRSPNAAFKSQR
jgi:hypothetical protein